LPGDRVYQAIFVTFTFGAAGVKTEKKKKKKGGGGRCQEERPKIIEDKNPYLSEGEKIYVAKEKRKRRGGRGRGE